MISIQRITTQLVRISAWISQGVNVIFLGGHEDETISARAYQNKSDPKWSTVYNILNRVFFWQDDHCQVSHYSDYLRAVRILNDRKNRQDSLLHKETEGS